MKSTRLVSTLSGVALTLVIGGCSQPPSAAAKPASIPLPAADANAGQPVVTRYHTCVCQEPQPTAIVWCGRHERGWAYGHVLRTWPLIQPLLPIRETGDSPGCPPADGTAKREITRWELSEAGYAQHRYINCLDHQRHWRMINAFPRDGRDGYKIASIPKRCDKCGMYHFNGRRYRSWIPIAIEAGYPLEGAAVTPRMIAAAEKPAGNAEGMSQRGGASTKTETDCAEGVSVAADHPALTPRCDSCRKAFAEGARWTRTGYPPQPFCEKCGVGVIAGRVLVGREAYELAAAADAALKFWRMHRCEVCAIGMMIGGQCLVCADCKSCHAP